MIHFVGAGPGAPDLITIRGQKLLAKADVIIYAGSLVNPALLEVKKPECAVYNCPYDLRRSSGCDEESGTVRKDNCPAAYGRPKPLWCDS